MKDYNEHNEATEQMSTNLRNIMKFTKYHESTKYHEVFKKNHCILRKT